jgi:hypothetical protein
VCRSFSNLAPEGSPKESEQLVQRVEVPLTFDAEFFTRLQDEVATLDTLQAGEQTALAEEIVSLSNDITSLTKPSKFNKTDLYRWRELFEVYLQAMVFFSTHEIDHGTRDSSTATKQLQWFQAEVVKRNIVESFKLPASRQALNRFIKINVTLLRCIKFQEINETAISKILKSTAYLSFHSLCTSANIFFVKNLIREPSLARRGSFRNLYSRALLCRRQWQKLFAPRLPKI